MSIISSLLQTKGSTSGALEIRLDTPFIRVRRNAHHKSNWIRGRVVFMNRSSARVAHITVHLTGVQQTVWYTDTMTADRIRSKDIIFSEERYLLPPKDTTESSKSYLIDAETYVWPFEIDLGSCPLESIAGLGDSFVQYEICATIAFAGRFAKNVYAKKPVTVVRELCTEEVDSQDLELYDHQVLPDKLDFRTTVPSQRFLFGHPIRVMFTLQSLEKGVAVESIALRLQESLHLQALHRNRKLYHHTDTMISEVEATEIENPALHSQALTDTLESQLEMILPLPEMVQRCRQSVHQGQGRITIAHKLLVEWRVRDKRGELHHNLQEFPLTITFPSGIAFDDKGVASIPREPTYLQRDAQGLFRSPCAPPTFGNHPSDPIVHPGLYLPYLEHSPDQPVCRTPVELDQPTTLCTRPLSRFTFPQTGHAPKDQPESLRSICLDRVPSYNTALRTPEMFTNDFDPSPVYCLKALNV